MLCTIPPPLPPREQETSILNVDDGHSDPINKKEDHLDRDDDDDNENTRDGDGDGNSDSGDGLLFPPRPPQQQRAIRQIIATHRRMLKNDYVLTDGDRRYLRKIVRRENGISARLSHLINSTIQNFWKRITGSHAFMPLQQASITLPVVGQLDANRLVSVYKSIQQSGDKFLREVEQMQEQKEALIKSKMEAGERPDPDFLKFSRRVPEGHFPLTGIELAEQLKSISPVTQHVTLRPEDRDKEEEEQGILDGLEWEDHEEEEEEETDNEDDAAV